MGSLFSFPHKTLIFTLIDNPFSFAGLRFKAVSVPGKVLGKCWSAPRRVTPKLSAGIYFLQPPAMRATIGAVSARTHRGRHGHCPHLQNVDFPVAASVGRG